MKHEYAIFKVYADALVDLWDGPWASKAQAVEYWKKLYLASEGDGFKLMRIDYTPVEVPAPKKPRKKSKILR